MVKICSCCKREKEVSEFHRDSSRKGGYRIYCQDCARNKRLPYKARISERERAYHRQYKKTYDKSALGRYHKLKSNAKQRGFAFDILPNEFVTWIMSQKMQCHYCKQVLQVDKRGLDSLSIDRRNNDGKYTIGNITLACWRCNVAKGSWFTEQQMLDIATRYLI